MAINIENTQFQQFVQFAEAQRSGRTLAQVGLEGQLGGHTIVVKERSDFIGNIGRRSDSKAINNQVRDLFRQSIADLFGGEDHIPQTVRDAMRLGDYGSGKPLSARRILAVNSAISDIISNEKVAEELYTGESKVMAELVEMSPVTKHGVEYYKEAINKATKTMTCSTIMSEMQNLECPGKYSTPTFDKDIVRQLDVTLPGGRKLENDTKIARDQITELVTKGEKKLFEELDASDRKRVNIILSLLTQETTKSVEYGGGMRLDPQGKQPTFFLTGFKEFTSEKVRYTLDFAEDGGFSLVSTHDSTGNMLIGSLPGMKTSSETFNKAVRFFSEIKVKISGEGMNSLAQLDWSGGHTKAIEEALAPKYPGDRLTGMEAGIPKEIMNNIEVTGSFKLFA